MHIVDSQRQLAVVGIIISLWTLGCDHALQLGLRRQKDLSSNPLKDLAQVAETQFPHLYVGIIIATTPYNCRIRKYMQSA